MEAGGSEALVGREVLLELRLSQALGEELGAWPSQSCAGKLVVSLDRSTPFHPGVPAAFASQGSKL